MRAFASPFAPDATAAALANIRKGLPGLGLCLVVTGAAYVLEDMERALAGKAWLEALVLAILMGTALRSLWNPSGHWQAGIHFSAKYLLEIAVVLLGLSVSAGTILAAGPALLGGIAGVVALAIAVSFAIGRAFGLPVRMALLIACGNSICGNSAIAAVAPVIGADGEEVAGSIAFTAVLGVAVVLGLPVLGLALGMKAAAFGAFAGLTVYAVPQVIAATAPMGAAAIHMGTLVKLVRVMLLGPVCLILSLLMPRESGETQRGGPAIGHLVPWFIVGFLLLVAVRSAGLVPLAIVAPAGHLATALTVVSMAALGLGVDVRSVAHAGARATMAVLASLAMLGVVSYTLLVFVRLA